jgi:hypothetical protein
MVRFQGRHSKQREHSREKTQREKIFPGSKQQHDGANRPPVDRRMLTVPAWFFGATEKIFVKK